MSSQEESIRQVIQEIKAQEPNFFCSHPLHILTWKSKKIEGALITKVNGQRYLGLQRKDVKGQDYWKYKLLTDGSNSEEQESSDSQPQLDNIAKFNQRQKEAHERKSNNYSEQSSGDS